VRVLSPVGRLQSQYDIIVSNWYNNRISHKTIVRHQREHNLSAPVREVGVRSGFTNWHKPVAIVLVISYPWSVFPTVTGAGVGAGSELGNELNGVSERIGPHTIYCRPEI
jgi:hypothetical protein